MFQKSSALIISTAILLVAALGIAAAASDPAVFGHALEEIALPACTVGQALGMGNGGWGCIDVPTQAPSPEYPSVALSAFADSASSISVNWVVSGVESQSNIYSLRLWRYGSADCTGAGTPIYYKVSPTPVPLIDKTVDSGLSSNTTHSYLIVYRVSGGWYHSACAAAKTPITCADGQVLKYSTSAGAWVCADDDSGVAGGQSCTVTATPASVDPSNWTSSISVLPAGFTGTPNVNVDCGNGTSDTGSPFQCTYTAAQAGVKTVTASVSSGTQNATCNTQVTVSATLSCGDCDDSNPCTTDTCNTGTGNCVHTNNTSSCGSGTGACSSGKCYALITSYDAGIVESSCLNRWNVPQLNNTYTSSCYQITDGQGRMITGFGAYQWRYPENCGPLEVENSFKQGRILCTSLTDIDRTTGSSIAYDAPYQTCGSAGRGVSGSFTCPAGRILDRLDFKLEKITDVDSWEWLFVSIGGYCVSLSGRYAVDDSTIYTTGDSLLSPKSTSSDVKVACPENYVLVGIDNYRALNCVKNGSGSDTVCQADCDYYAKLVCKKLRITNP